MRSRAAAAFFTAGLTLVAALGSAGAANADPRNGAPITITCDNGSTYEAVLFCNGEWSPGLDTASNAVLVPFSIGPSEGAFTDPEGNVIEPIDEPISVKGNAAQGHRSKASCTFERAKADGRWQRAYGGSASLDVPDDLRDALAASPSAKRMWDVLTRTNRFAVVYRVQEAKRAETRARRIQQYVEMLARGDTPHPQKGRPA